MKICTKCGIRKSISDFYKRKNRVDGVNSWCSDCSCKNNIQRRKDNPEREREYRRRWIRDKDNHQAQMEYQKQWRINNSQKASKAVRDWQKRNPDKVCKHCKRWKLNHPEKVKLIQHNWYKKDYLTIMGNLRRRIGVGIRESLRNNKNGRHWENLVGYTVQELKKHLELKFTEGMTWERFLNGEIHIDHIFPLSRLYFDSAEDPTFKFAWSLKNLQPLWVKDNLKKLNKVA